jgi:hypothetical protein
VGTRSLIGIDFSTTNRANYKAAYGYLKRYHDWLRIFVQCQDVCGIVGGFNIWSVHILGDTKDPPFKYTNSPSKRILSKSISYIDPAWYGEVVGHNPTDSHARDRQPTADRLYHSTPYQAGSV